MSEKSLGLLMQCGYFMGAACGFWVGYDYHGLNAVGRNWVIAGLGVVSLACFLLALRAVYRERLGGWEIAEDE